MNNNMNNNNMLNNNLNINRNNNFNNMNLNKNINNNKYINMNNFNQNNININQNIISNQNRNINNNIQNNNLFNNGHFNFNNNYLMQNMQNINFQQLFNNYLKQQYIFQLSMTQRLLNIKNNLPQMNQIHPQMKAEISEHQKVIQDLLNILREPNIQAKNDDEIIQQFSSPEILSSDITTEIITEFLNLEPDLLNPFGNKLNGKWAKNEKRGGLRYRPPVGWIGFGLNVINKYDNGNNDWLACDGREGEWCVGYHGAGRDKSSDEVKIIIKSILKNNLKPGRGQSFKNDININRKNPEYIKVGVGVYCSPDISVLEKYAGFININGKKYKVGIMLRCKRDKIRIPQTQSNYWVLEGKYDQETTEWSATSARVRGVFKDEHKQGVTKAVFSPDYSYVLTSSYDQIGRLWTISKHENIRAYLGAKDRLWSITPSPNGQYVAELQGQGLADYLDDTFVFSMSSTKGSSWESGYYATRTKEGWDIGVTFQMIE